MTVDRIENGIAIVEENGKRTDIPLCELPEGTREGSLLKRENGRLLLDPETERAQREKLKKRTDALFKK